MDCNKRLNTVQDIQDYLMCKKQATFTLVSGKTGKHFTYRIKYDDGTWIVAVLTGDDNTSSYTRLGRMYVHSTSDGRQYINLYVFHEHSQAPSLLAVKMVITEPERYLKARGEFWVPARCRRCGRLLTTPQAIADGIGHKCKDKEENHD